MVDRIARAPPGAAAGSFSEKPDRLANPVKAIPPTRKSDEIFNPPEVRFAV